MGLRRTHGGRQIQDRVFLVVGLGLCGIVLGAFFGGVLNGLERQSVDVRLTIRGDREPLVELIIVGIDDVTFDELDLQWPFPRSEHALVIDRIDRDGPRVIIYDVQFTEESDPAEGNALIQAVADAENVVLATTEVDEFGGTNIFGGIDLEALGACAGTALVAPERGGVIRRTPYEIEGLRTLAIVGAEVAGGGMIEAADVPAEGTWIDFYGRSGSVPAISFSRVSDAPLGFFTDRIVVVGATAPALQDLHADLRGFIRFVESVSAEEVITVLNRYLTDMSEAIQAHGGRSSRTWATGSWRCSARRSSRMTTPTEHLRPLGRCCGLSYPGSTNGSGLRTWSPSRSASGLPAAA